MGRGGRARWCDGDGSRRRFKGGEGGAWQQQSHSVGWLTTRGVQKGTNTGRGE